jgi:hypothetical protein
MRNALYVASGAALLAMICSVFCAFAWWKASATATRLRSMSSTLGELAEIRDYLTKIDHWSKRINSRLVMAERRDAVKHPGDAPQLTSKEQLRQRAMQQGSLIPGQPTRHGDH